MRQLATTCKSGLQIRALHGVLDRGGAKGLGGVSYDEFEAAEAAVAALVVEDCFE